MKRLAGLIQDGLVLRFLYKHRGLTYNHSGQVNVMEEHHLCRDIDYFLITF